MLTAFPISTKVETRYKLTNKRAMEEFIEKYSRWFSYCDREKLKEEMRQDLSAMAEPTNENSGLHLQRVSVSLPTPEEIWEKADEMLPSEFTEWYKEYVGYEP